MSDLPSPRAIIFDWDNTLVNTWPIIHEALTATFDAMGQPAWSMEQTKARVRKSMRDSFPELFGPNWQKAGEIYQQHYRAIHLERLQALPRAEEVLKAIRDKKLYCVVVSNKKGPNLRLEVEKLGWQPYFGSVIGSDDAIKDKPHADPVHLAFDKSGIQAGPHVWFVGDSEIDLDCAERAGCVGVLYGAEARDHVDYTATHYQGFPYHVHVHDHTGLLKLINDI